MITTVDERRLSRAVPLADATTDAGFRGQTQPPGQRDPMSCYFCVRSRTPTSSVEFNSIKFKEAGSV